MAARVETNSTSAGKVSVNVTPVVKFLNIPVRLSRHFDNG
jgi:hypothetical protein